jgi:hypothetical protein
MEKLFTGINGEIMVKCMYTIPNLNDLANLPIKKLLVKVLLYTQAAGLKHREVQSAVVQGDPENQENPENLENPEDLDINPF